MLRSFLLFILFFIVFTAHNCLHDQWDQPLTFIDTGGPDYANLRPGEGRALQQAYESIRIHVDFSFIQGHDEKIVNYIQHQLMPSAVSFFQSTLNIVRLTTNIKIKSSCYDLGPPDYLLTTGMAADLVIIIVLDQLDMTVLARSGACALSSVNSRPVYGALIFNSNNFPTETVTDQEQALVTTIHEMTHILGFSSNVYPFYIDPTTGKRRTGHLGNVTIDGQITNFLDLEPLTSRLKTYFGCDTVPGAYLENQGGNGSVGSHFERRIFMNDLMTATFVANPIVSQFTLALLEGTGWYMPDYTMAETFTWGQGQGCQFLDGSCIDENDKPNFPEFCEFLTESGCSYTGQGKAACGVAAGSMKVQASLATGWDRWHNKTIMTDLYGDNCPYYWSPYWDDCANPNNKARAFIKEEIYGDRSRCFVGNLTQSETQTSRAGYCFSTECYSVDYDYGYVLAVTVGEETVECLQQGPVTIPGFNGVIECPDPNVFCSDYSPTSCSRGCLGRGECRSDRCLCPEGWGGRDCGLRVADDNCDRCSHEKVNKGCYGDICQPNTYADDIPYGSTDEPEVDINEEFSLTEDNGEWSVADGESNSEYGWEDEVTLTHKETNNLYFKQEGFCDLSSCMKWD